MTIVDKHSRENISNLHICGGKLKKCLDIHERWIICDEFAPFAPSIMHMLGQKIEGRNLLLTFLNAGKVFFVLIITVITYLRCRESVNFPHAEE